MSTQVFNQLSSKLFGNFHIRTLLIVPFVFQIIVIVGLTGFLSYRNGQQAVNQLANQIHLEITERIQQYINSYLEIPSTVVNINTHALLNHQLHFHDLRNWLPHLIKQSQTFDVLSYIYAGNEAGDYIALQRLEDNLLGYNLKDSLTNNLMEEYLLDKEGQHANLNKPQEYNSHNRPWYKTAVSAGKAGWTEIYKFIGLTGTEQLGMSFVSPYYEETEGGEKKLQGVLGADFTLSKISDFLQSLTIGKSGKTFIMERSGLLVGGSFPYPSFDEKDNRLTAFDVDDPLIKATAKQIRHHFGNVNDKKDNSDGNKTEELNFDKITKGKDLLFKVNGEKQLVHIEPFANPFNLDWLIVVVVPENDFMAEIHANTRLTIILVFIALVLTTLLGIVTSRWIAFPILRLNEAAKKLAGGDWNQYPSADRSDELGELAKSFNMMARQLKESFETLGAKNADLQRLGQVKDEFLANTSHELRTPLNGIIGIAESLIEGATGSLPKETCNNLNMIILSGRRLANLVNNILDFAKLKHKNIYLQIKAVDIHKVIDTVFTTHRRLASEKGLELIHSIAMNLPFVLADENRLQQILNNLINNAIKFTDHGHVKVSVELVTSTENDKKIYFNVTVSDTGRGIPTDKLDRIFESFEQADGSAAREYGGTGLGLAVTKKLIELHNGQIFVNSTVGRGSQFIFTLPLSQEEQSSSSFSTLSDVNVPHKTLASTSSSKMGSEIFIIDDDTSSLQTLVNHLAQTDYTITQATEGNEALSMISRGYHPNLILLDVSMPDITGYEVCRQLRKTFPANELPILMLTSKDQTSDLVEGFNSGANDYLAKPISKHELIVRVKVNLELAKLNTAYRRFVPHHFLQFFDKQSITDIKLGDQTKRDMSILYSNIHSFGLLSETMTSEENFKFINNYLSRIEPIILEHDGFIDKYLGEAILVLFSGYADQALKASIAILRRLEEYNQRREENGYAPIQIGMGVNTGTVMLGTVGGQHHMEGTVISEAVNLAYCVENLTRSYGVPLLITHYTFSYLKNQDQYNIRWIDHVKLECKSEPIPIYEVFDVDSPKNLAGKQATRKTFAKALSLYEDKDFSAARTLFESCMQENPLDTVAQIYLKRCTEKIEGNPTDM